MKKSAISAILVVLLVAALVVAVGVGSMGFKDWNVKGWFNGWGQSSEQPNNPDTPDIPINPDNPNVGNEDMGNGGAIVSESESFGISLMSAKLPVSAYAANGIDTQADTAYKLTATLSPIGVDTTCDWSVEWKNAKSTWANGKNVTDYVTVAPTSSGGNVANVTCKQAFGEQVTVKVISAVKNDVYATCTVDYAKRVTGFSVALKKNTTACTAIDFDDTGYSYTFTCTPTYGVGTKNDSGTFTYTYTLADEFKNATKYFPETTASGNKLLDMYFTPSSDSVAIATPFSTVIPTVSDLTSGTYTETKTGYLYNDFVGVKNSLGVFMGRQGWGQNGFRYLSGMIATVKKSINSYSGNVLKVTCSYQGQYSTYTGVQYVKKGTSSFASLNVSSVSLDKGSLTF
ncbi:MAG: hypothetical protein K2J16_03835 [Clostridia bacterium]|nr:hypothetical protein [Clostridia bacterium]